MGTRRGARWWVLAVALLAAAGMLAMCGKDDEGPNNSNNGSNNGSNNDVVPYQGAIGPDWDEPIVGFVESEQVVFLPNVELTGFAYGPVAQVRYETDRGESGELASSAGPWTVNLELERGDTTVTVTAATADGTEVSDAVTLTYDPDGVVKLELSELGVFVDEGSNVEAHVQVQVTGEVDSVELVAVDESGAVTDTLAPLADDGVSPDEGPGDFLFAGTFVPPDGEVRQLRIRAVAEVSGETIFSQTRTLHVLRRPTESEFEAMLSLPDRAAEWYNAHLEEGTEEEAAAATLAELEGQPGVTHAELTPGGDTLTWRLDSGAQGVLILREWIYDGAEATSSEAQQALTASPRIGSDDALLLVPFFSHFESACANCRSEADAVKDTLEEAFCPNITPDLKKDGEANVQAFDDIGGQGLVLMSSHGGPTFFYLDDVYNPWGRRILVPTIATSTVATTANIREYSVELMLKALILIRVAKGGPVFLAITPLFVRHYVGSLPSSIVVASSCRSMVTGFMAAELLAKGAKAVIGYQKRARIGYAADISETFFDRLAHHSESVEEALRYAATDAGGLNYGLSYSGDGSVKVADRCSGWTSVVETFGFEGKSVRATYDSVDVLQKAPNGYDVVETRARCTYSDHTITEWFGNQIRGSIVGSGSIDHTFEPPHVKLLLHDEGSNKYSVGIVPDPIEENWVLYSNWVSGSLPFYEESGCLISPNGITDFTSDEVTVTETEIRGSRVQSDGGGTLQIDFRYRR